jgi:hypothetical protein
MFPFDELFDRSVFEEYIQKSLGTQSPVLDLPILYISDAYTLSKGSNLL